MLGIRLLGVLLVAAVVALPLYARQVDADRSAIEAVIGHWNLGWETKDAKLAASGYSDDADWTNAFGFYRKGRAAIEEYLTGVSRMPFVMAAQSRIVQQEIRCVDPKVALVRTPVERAGQTTPDGKPLATRHTSHLRVFVKSGDRWEIVSHLISDARDPAEPRR